MNPFPDSQRPRVLIVTGMSGAGKSTALEVFEDLGWETIDNAPLRLIEGLLIAGPQSDEAPLAIGIDSRTRGFDPQAILALVDTLIATGIQAGIFFLDASSLAIERRYSETRRPHPLARERPVLEGIKAERELVAPLARRAEVVVDTTDYSTNHLQQVIRNQFGDEAPSGMAVTITSFGYSRGMAPLADLVFDMRYLDNPHWYPGLREQTGQDAAVQRHIEADPAFAPTFGKIRDLVLEMLPHYEAQGRAYLTIAFGCTGGKHRSVFSAERMAEVLRAEGYDPSVVHRNLPSVSAQPQTVPSEDSPAESG